MFLVSLFQFLRGYLCVQVDGFFAERFLNLCIRRGIYLWKVQKTGRTQLRANVSVAGFRQMRPIARQSRCNVRIKRRVGIPFFLHRYRKRKFFAAGIMLCVVLITVLTRFVWVIQITGNERLSTEQMMEALSQCGIRIGMQKSKVDTAITQSMLMTQQPDIAWVGIALQGTTVTVEVKERAQKPPFFPKDQPCDIVAKRDGVIEQIEITNGNRLVKKNDVVRKGQVLVSGSIESQTVGMRFVHSDGIIKARTWHEQKVPLPQYEEIRTRTGKKKSKHGLKLFDFYVRLYMDDKVAFDAFERVSEIKRLSLWNHTVLPASFHYDQYYELQITKQEMSAEETTAYYQQQMDAELEGIEILSRQIEVSQDGKEMTILYECLEEIGEKTNLSPTAIPQ